MVNLIDLGANYFAANVQAKETEEGKELKTRKAAFKEAFISYLNWGGKYEVQEIQAKTLENKAARKMNEWARKKEQSNEAAPIYTKVWNAVSSMFLWFLNCFYTPKFPTAEKESFEAFYTLVHRSDQPGARAVQAARTAKHAFKEGFHAANEEEKRVFFAAASSMIAKANYWARKYTETT